jgi:hypothetical protein
MTKKLVCTSIFMREQLRERYLRNTPIAGDVTRGTGLPLNICEGGYVVM